MIKAKVEVSVKKKVVQKVPFFFDESLYFAFIFIFALFECMPHPYKTSIYASKYLHNHCSVVLFVLSIQTLF